MHKRFATIVSVLIILAVIIAGYFAYSHSPRLQNIKDSGVIGVNTEQQENVVKKYKTAREVEASSSFKDFIERGGGLLNFKEDAFSYASHLAIGVYYLNYENFGKGLFTLEKIDINNQDDYKNPLIYDILEVDPYSYCFSCQKNEVVVTMEECLYNNQNFQESIIAVRSNIPGESRSVYEAWHVNPKGPNFEKISDLENVDCNLDWGSGDSGDEG